MFNSVGDLPLHPLVIHAVVIGIPLTLLLALLFGFPRTRGWARWPVVIAAVGCVPALFVAKESGEALASVVVQGDPVASIIMEHSALASQLFFIQLAVAVLAVLAVVLVGRGGAKPARDGALIGLLVVAAALASFWTYRVGDLGARAAWNPAGTVDYSSGSR